MSYNPDRGAHFVYALQYHFIQVVRYIMHIFINNKIIDFLKQIIRGISYALYAVWYFMGIFLGNLGETLPEDDTSLSSMFEYIKCIPMKASVAVEARSPKLRAR
ncbi:MAG: hypothetical protein QXZ12_08900 [Thermoplasmata archaeon]